MADDCHRKRKGRFYVLKGRLISFRPEKSWNRAKGVINDDPYQTDRESVSVRNVIDAFISTGETGEEKNRPTDWSGKRSLAVAKGKWWSGGW